VPLRLRSQLQDLEARCQLPKLKLGPVWGRAPVENRFLMHFELELTHLVTTNWPGLVSVELKFFLRLEAPTTKVNKKVTSRPISREGALPPIKLLGAHASMSPEIYAMLSSIYHPWPGRAG